MKFDMEYQIELADDCEDVTLEVHYSVDEDCDYGVDGSSSWDEYNVYRVVCTGSLEAKKAINDMFANDKSFMTMLEEAAKEDYMF